MSHFLKMKQFHVNMMIITDDAIQFQEFESHFIN